VAEFRSWLELWQDMSFIEDGLREDLVPSWINFLELVRDKPEIVQEAALGFLSEEADCG
jgi:hypothetical protein